MSTQGTETDARTSASQAFSVAGQVALVTGASSGIGRHLAGALADAGAHVIAIARRADRLTELARDHGCVPHACDLGAVTDFDALMAQISQHHGTPRILLNAAGVNLREPVGDITMASWNTTQHLNVTVPFMLARAMVDQLTAEGTANGARIINFASLQSVRAFANSVAYGASKGAVTQLTRAMAEAWGAHGVTANAIAPGFFPTELTAPVFADDAKADHNAGQTCLGRNGDLADLTGPALFLSSPASGYVTGQVLYVDGGFTAK